MGKNIIITNHAILRREHQKPKDKDVLVQLVKQIDTKFNISSKENKTYKIYIKNTIAIIKNTDKSLILITAYGFEKYGFKINNLELKISIAISKEERRLQKNMRRLQKNMDRGMIHKIFRINFLNKKVECGVICLVSKSKNAKDVQRKDKFRYKLILDWKLFSKFQNIPMEHYHLYFNEFEEILNIVHLENEEYFLNDFKRKVVFKQEI